MVFKNVLKGALEGLVILMMVVLAFYLAGEFYVSVFPGQQKEVVEIVTVVECESDPVLANEDEVRSFADEYGIPVDVSRDIYQAADSNGIEPWIFYRLVETESSFRENVESYAGAIGLAQVKLSTARDLDPTVTRSKLFQRRTNLALGAEYLARMKRRFGTTTDALRAYNAGPARVKDQNAGRSYANKVLRE